MSTWVWMTLLRTCRPPSTSATDVSSQLVSMPRISPTAPPALRATSPLRGEDYSVPPPLRRCAPPPHCVGRTTQSHRPSGAARHLPTAWGGLLSPTAPPALRATSPLRGEDYSVPPPLRRCAPPPHCVGRTTQSHSPSGASRHLPTAMGGLLSPTALPALRATSPLRREDYSVPRSLRRCAPPPHCVARTTQSHRPSGAARHL